MKKQISFHDNFGLIVLKFIMYFSTTMFVVGVTMVFLSIEKNKIMPISIFGFGIFILLFLIIERNLFAAGHTEIDLEKNKIKQRHFFLRHNISDLKESTIFTIEQVVYKNKIISYNVYAQTSDRDILIGQESDKKVLSEKLDTIKNHVSCNVIEKNKYLDGKKDKNNKKSFTVTLILILLIVLLRDKTSITGNQHFLLSILVLLPACYLLFYFIKKVKK